MTLLTLFFIQQLDPNEIGNMISKKDLDLKETLPGYKIQTVFQIHTF